MYYRNSYTTDSKIRVAVGFGARPKRFGSRCFVCQTKKLNSRRHIPERLIGQRLAKSSKGVLCQPKWRNLFRRLKSIAVCTFGYSLLALNSDHFDAWTTKLQPVAKVLETLYRILAWMACPWSCACDPSPLPPPLIKVASNTTPYLEEELWMGGRREVSIISHRPVTRSDLKQERSFFRGSVSTFLQVVVAYNEKTRWPSGFTFLVWKTAPNDVNRLVKVWRQNQLPSVSLNSQSTCFGGSKPILL